jgi:hypothetical protein
MKNFNQNGSYANDKLDISHTLLPAFKQKATDGNIGRKSFSGRRVECQEIRFPHVEIWCIERIREVQANPANRKPKLQKGTKPRGFFYMRRYCAGFWSSRRVAGCILNVSGRKRKAENKPKNKQDGRFICCQTPSLEQFALNGIENARDLFATSSEHEDF